MMPICDVRSESGPSPREEKLIEIALEKAGPIAREFITDIIPKVIAARQSSLRRLLRLLCLPSPG